MKMEILTLIVRLAALLITAFVIPTLRAWLEKKIENESLAQVQEWAAKAVQAAEQVHNHAKKDDPDGTKRRAFATNFLERLCVKHGVLLTNDEIKVLIEAAVDEVNNSHCLGDLIHADEGEG